MLRSTRDKTFEEPYVQSNLPLKILKQSKKHCKHMHTCIQLNYSIKDRWKKLFFPIRDVGFYTSIQGKLVWKWMPATIFDVAGLLLKINVKTMST